jgi:hypothetical protein
MLGAVGAAAASTAAPAGAIATDAPAAPARAWTRLRGRGRRRNAAKTRIPSEVVSDHATTGTPMPVAIPTIDDQASGPGGPGVRCAPMAPPGAGGPPPAPGLGRPTATCPGVAVGEPSVVDGLGMGASVGGALGGVTTGAGVGAGVGFGVGLSVGLGFGFGALITTRVGDTVRSVTVRSPFPLPLVTVKLYFHEPTGSFLATLNVTPLA